MSRSRRTLLSVLVFLSFKDGLVLTQISPGTLPTPTENYQNFRSPTLQPANLKPDLLSAAQRLLAGSQRPTFNDFSKQPFIAKPPVVTIEPSYQEVPVNVNPAPNLPISFTQTTCNTGSPVFCSPETLPIETVDTVTVSSAAPSTFEYLCEYDQNYTPLSPMPYGRISQALPLPEAYYIDNFVQGPELPQFSEFSQSLVTVPTTSIPSSPFTRFSNSFPSNFPQNVFLGSDTGDLIPALYPETINSPQTIVCSQAETVPVNMGSNVIDSGSGYPIPLSLQINMPPPTSELPIILLSSPSSPPSNQDTSYMTPLPPMVPPLIVMERSRSRWRNILPIILIALCDGGCCQNSGNNRCSGGGNIPIPYPIPIPTNSPIILSGSTKKRKSVRHSDDD